MKFKSVYGITIKVTNTGAVIKMNVVILKYNAGNVRSVAIALNRLGIEPSISDDKDVLLGADKVIFPGVGQASTAMDYLREKELDKLVPTFKMPFLGICLGLQLMCRRSEENDTQCLDIFPLHVLRFPPIDKVPHMGWNTINQLRGPLMQDIQDNSYLYFVHSYYAEISDDCIATCNYGVPFSAALQRENFYAVQAHPEKSAETGSKIIENFLNL